MEIPIIKNVYSLNTLLKNSNKKMPQKLFLWWLSNILALYCTIPSTEYLPFQRYSSWSASTFDLWHFWLRYLLQLWGISSTSYATLSPRVKVGWGKKEILHNTYIGCTGIDDHIDEQDDLLLVGSQSRTTQSTCGHIQGNNVARHQHFSNRCHTLHLYLSSSLFYLLSNPFSFFFAICHLCSPSLRTISLRWRISRELLLSGIWHLLSLPFVLMWSKSRRTGYWVFCCCHWWFVDFLRCFFSPSPLTLSAWAAKTLCVT